MSSKVAWGGRLRGPMVTTPPSLLSGGDASSNLAAVTRAVDNHDVIDLVA